MAVLRQENWQGQQRVDIPHLRSIESGAVGDMDVIAGLMLADEQALIVRGFDILGTIGSVASSLQLNVASASLINYNATENGSIFAVPANRAPETLTSTNTKVFGSFTPNSVNYIGLDLRRSVDDSTADLVMFLDANTDLEVPKTVPLARTLDYLISISTSDFSSTPTLAPVAKITTDAANNAILIEDARQLFFRLGSGGSIPNRKNAYIWPQTKAENLIGNVFLGGDKAITGLKSSLNAIMTRIWELGGGEYWYSGTADRNVKMFRSGMVLPNGEYFSWDGTNLTWRGLTFIYPNSSGLYNDVKDQLVALPGLTNLLEGECIYIDLDYSQTRVNPNGLQAVKTNTQLLGNPTIPGERNIIAWRLNNVIFTRDSYFPVGGLAVPPATTFSLGVVALSKAPTNPLFPIVLTNTEKNAALGVAALDGVKNVIGAGLGRDVLLGNGAVTIGNSSRDQQIVLDAAPGPNIVAIDANEQSNPDNTARYIQGWSADGNYVGFIDNKGVLTTYRDIASNLTGQEDLALVSGTGGFTAVTLVGTGTGTITPTGNSGTKNIYFVKITTSGGLGVGAFRLSRDGGFSYDGALTIPALGVYTDPVSQVTITFAGLFVVNDVYSFRGRFGPLALFNDNQNQSHGIVDHSGFPMGRRSELREEWLEPAAFSTTSSKWAALVTGAGFTAGVLDAGSTGTLSTDLYKLPTSSLAIESDTNVANDHYFAITRNKIFYPQALNVLDTTGPGSSFANSVAEWETQTDSYVGNSEYFMGWGDTVLSGTPTAAIYFHQANHGNWQAITKGTGGTNIVTTSFGPNPVYNFPYRFRIETKNKFVPSFLRFVEDLTFPSAALGNNTLFSMFNFPGGTIEWVGARSGLTLYKSGGVWTQKNLTDINSYNVATSIWASSDTLGAAYAATSTGSINRFDAGMGQWVNSKLPYTLTNDIYYTWGLNQNYVWAVGFAGSILHYNGEWASVVSPTTKDLFCVFPLSTTDAWAVGEDGTAIHWNGTTWSVIATPVAVATDVLRSVWGASSNDVWAVGGTPQATAFIHWDGVSWTSVPGPVNVIYESLWGFASNDVWAVSANGLIAHWDGVSWTSVPGALTGISYGKIWGIAPNDIWYIATDSGPAPAVQHWDGVSWNAAPPPPVGTEGRSIFGFASNQILALGTGFGQTFVSVWNGVSWSTPYLYSYLPTLVLRNTPMWGFSLKSLWVFLNSPRIFCGQHLLNDFDDNYEHIRGLWGSSSTDIWSVGFIGRMFHWDGVSWNPFAAITDNDLYGVWGVNANDIWAVGNSGFIQHWDGLTWTSVASPTSKNLYAIMGTDATHIWAVGYDSLTNNSDIIFWDGATWTVLSTQIGIQLGQIAVISTTEVYFSSGPYVPTFIPGTHNNVVKFNGVSFSSITPPLVSGLPVAYMYTGGLMNGKLNVGATDISGKSHLFSLDLSAGYTNTARFFINENIVAEIENNVPGGVPMKFMFGTKSNGTNVKLRMLNGPLQINIGRYTSTPQL